MKVRVISRTPTICVVCGKPLARGRGQLVYTCSKKCRKYFRGGKKVRRDIWNRMDRCRGRYIEIPIEYNNYFRNHKGHEVTMSFEEVFATDWEIVEKKKILSDKAQAVLDGHYYDEIDIELALKEFLDIIRNYQRDTDFTKMLMKDAKEIFGERLIE